MLVSNGYREDCPNHLTSSGFSAIIITHETYDKMAEDNSRYKHISISNNDICVFNITVCNSI